MMSFFLHRTLFADPMLATRGEGIYLHTADGRKIIDGSGGAAVACLGHGHPRINAAIAEQLSKVAYVHTVLFTNQAAEELAEILVGHEPGGLSHAYFCSSGSEGNEAAIKLARQYFLEIGQPQRTRFIARRQGYHGNTLGALSAGGNMMRRAPYAPILSGCSDSRSTFTGGSSSSGAAPATSRATAELPSIMVQCRSTSTAGQGSCPDSTARSDASTAARPGPPRSPSGKAGA